MAQISSIERKVLSGSTNGRGIKITATTSADANTLHTATSTAGQVDEVFLFCYNSSTSDCNLYICAGGTTDPDDIITLTIPAKQGDMMVMVGECFNGGVAIKAYASTANVLIIRGYVNTMTMV